MYGDFTSGFLNELDGFSQPSVLSTLALAVPPARIPATPSITFEHLLSKYSYQRIGLVGDGELPADDAPPYLSRSSPLPSMQPPASPPVQTHKEVSWSAPWDYKQPLLNSAQRWAQESRDERQDVAESTGLISVGHLLPTTAVDIDAYRNGRDHRRQVRSDTSALPTWGRLLRRMPVAYSAVSAAFAETSALVAQRNGLPAATDADREVSCVIDDAPGFHDEDSRDTLTSQSLSRFDSTSENWRPWDSPPPPPLAETATYQFSPYRSGTAAAVDAYAEAEDQKHFAVTTKPALITAMPAETPSPQRAINVGSKRGRRECLPERVDCECGDEHQPGNASCSICMSVPMICCDICNRWMHLPCLGLQDTDIPFDDFACKRCAARKGKSNIRRDAGGSLHAVPLTNAELRCVQQDASSLQYFTSFEHGSCCLPPLHVDSLPLRAALLHTLIFPEVQAVGATAKRQVVRAAVPWTQSPPVSGKKGVSVGRVSIFDGMPDVALAHISSFLHLHEAGALMCVNARLRDMHAQGVGTFVRCIDVTGSLWTQKGPSRVSSLAHMLTDTMLLHSLVKSNTTSSVSMRRTLDLSFSPLLSSASIAQAVQRLAPQLQTLRLSFLQQIDNETIKRLFSTIVQPPVAKEMLLPKRKRRATILTDMVDLTPRRPVKPVPTNTPTFILNPRAPQQLPALQWLDVSGCNISMNNAFMQLIGAACPSIQVLKLHLGAHVDAGSDWVHRVQHRQLVPWRQHASFIFSIGILHVIYALEARNGCPFASLVDAMAVIRTCLPDLEVPLPVLSIIGEMRGVWGPSATHPFAQLCAITTEMPVHTADTPSDTTPGDVCATTAVAFPLAMSALSISFIFDVLAAAAIPSGMGTLDNLAGAGADAGVEARAAHVWSDSGTDVEGEERGEERRELITHINMLQYDNPVLVSGSALQQAMADFENECGPNSVVRTANWMAAGNMLLEHKRKRFLPQFFGVPQSAAGAPIPQIAGRALRLEPRVDASASLPLTTAGGEENMLQEGLLLTETLDTAALGLGLLEECLNTQPNARLHMHVAWLYDRLYKWPDSWRHCMRAMQLEPSFGTAALQIAGSLMQAGAPYPSRVTGPLVVRGVDLAPLLPSHIFSVDDWLDRAEASTTFFEGTYHHIHEERAVFAFREGRYDDAIDAFRVAFLFSPWHYNQGDADVAAQLKKVLKLKREAMNT
jgi:hypothetical protein